MPPLTVPTKTMSAEFGLGTIALHAQARGLGPGIPSVFAPVSIGPGPCSTHAGDANAAALLKIAASRVMTSRVDFWLNMKHSPTLIVLGLPRTKRSVTTRSKI